ncbi:RNA-directed DNA polymerase from mobile element jockey-like [Plakobranchus ocellatus]|uniref:RNA-directed DNA polymerase from mobile element jockey-like n=1 Tax=Plakobranchus ocellatus TaxID=259542 RepID=A0AAV3XV31_9GAST|nr:RNA-directed DNA polymerase from mobile element jockey-like [Plakobranchus ocellatus]
MKEKIVTHASHAKLQYYRHNYCLVTMTGVLGCRWHRYQQSTRDNRKRDFLNFFIVLLAFLYIVVFFIFWLIARNDVYFITVDMFQRVGKYIPWYGLGLGFSSATFAYLTVILLLCVLHVIHGHQLYIHLFHVVFCVLTLIACIVVSILIDLQWPHMWPLMYISLKKDKLNIATWNIRTLLQKGKLENIKQEMERMKLNILGLSEVRWKGAGKITSGGHEIIYSGGTESEKGVGIIVDQTVTKAIKGYWALSDRVLLVKIAGKPVDLNIIQVYAPTANSNDGDLDKFYNELDTAKTQCKSQDPLIIMGNFNAKVGTEKVDDIVGKHGLGIRNERGEKLIEWYQTNNIIVGNTWFQQPPRRKWTYGKALVTRPETR